MGGCDVIKICGNYWRWNHGEPSSKSWSKYLCSIIESWCSWFVTKNRSREAAVLYRRNSLRYATIHRFLSVFLRRCWREIEPIVPNGYLFFSIPILNMGRKESLCIENRHPQCVFSRDTKYGTTPYVEPGSIQDST